MRHALYCGSIAVICSASVYCIQCVGLVETENVAPRMRMDFMCVFGAYMPASIGPYPCARASVAFGCGGGGGVVGGSGGTLFIMVEIITHSGFVVNGHFCSVQ